MYLEQFRDVSIYLGRKEVVRSTRLELSVKCRFLHNLLSSLTICDGCREPAVLVFPEDDQDVSSLLQFFRKSGLSIVRSK